LVDFVKKYDKRVIEAQLQAKREEEQKILKDQQRKKELVNYSCCHFIFF
jgi:hypothetical protein